MPASRQKTQKRSGARRRWLSAAAILLGLVLSVALGRLVAAAPNMIAQISASQASQTTALHVAP